MLLRWWTRPVRWFEGQCLAAAVLLALAAAASAQEAAPTGSSSTDELLNKTFSINVGPQQVSTALIELSKQAGVQVAMAGGSLDDFYTQGIRGDYSLRDALTKLLEGTNFEFRQTGANTITINATLAGSPVSDAAQPMPGPEPEQTEAVVRSEPVPEPEQIETIPVRPPEVREVQSPDSGGATRLDTMVVTSGKREQYINEFAGSVSAISGDKLEKIGAQSLKDYLKLVPGVTMNEFEANGSAPIIRGIATDTIPGIGTRTTGIFIDEVPMSDLHVGQSPSDMNPFDLERVEVLKGPQGTLFGSSAIGGAIRYITNKPELNVWQTKLYGTYTATKEGGQKPLAAGMVNVPLGRSAAVRAVGLHRTSPGYIDDTKRGLEDVGGLKQSAYRALGTWLPLDDLKLTATWLDQRSQAPDAEFADQRERLERSNTNGATARDSRFSTANLVGTYDFEWGTLLSSTSRITKETSGVVRNDRFFPDAPGGTGADDQPEPIHEVFYSGSADGISQELRLTSPEGFGRWHWLAGVAWLRSDSDSNSNWPVFLFEAALARSPQDPFAAPVFPIGTPGGTVTGSDDTQILVTSFDGEVTELGLFGEVTRRLWDRWELTLGARLFQTELAADTLLHGAEVPAFYPGQTEVRQHDELKEKGVNPKASARFLLNPNVNLYVLAARGFQFGGVQLTPQNLAVEAIVEGQAGPTFEPYKSSVLWNFEIGARTEWWDRRLQFDATVFHQRWKDLQLTQIVFFQGQPLTGFITNIGRATSEGVELTIRVSPLRGLSWLSSAAWVDAVTRVQVEGSGLDHPPGWQLPGAARFQMANVLSYEQPFLFLGDWTAGVSLTHTHTGPIFNDLSHSATFGNYDTYDLGLHLLNSSFSWQPDLRFNLSNLLDTRGIGGVFGAGAPDDDVYFIRPRTGILSLEVRF